MAILEDITVGEHITAKAKEIRNKIAGEVEKDFNEDEQLVYDIGLALGQLAFTLALQDLAPEEYKVMFEKIKADLSESV